VGVSEVGKEIGEHRRHGTHLPHDRVISILEASLLSIVALLAAYSGYSAAKWSTESRLALARASAARTEANRAAGAAEILRSFDASTFNAWFTAYTVGNKQAEAIAERRFRPAFRAAFDAWRARSPETNRDAPPGPTYMPQYREPGLARAAALDRRADELFEDGDHGAKHADDYIRTTVFLATVLFLVGISTQFPFRGVRYGLLSLGSLLLVVAIVQVVQLPRPP
jgi:hypothetical protein